MDDGGGAVSLGNYKGVMLCNRPVAPGAADAGGPKGATGVGGASAPSPFRAGISHERVNPRGYDPSLPERLVRGALYTWVWFPGPPACIPVPPVPQQAAGGGPSAKPPSAVQKHKAWLSELKKRQEELKDQELIEEMQKEERKLAVRAAGGFPFVAAGLMLSPSPLCRSSWTHKRRFETPFEVSLLTRRLEVRAGAVACHMCPLSVET